ncbi:MAG: PHB depolymerase family esterase [Polyangiaceae bacterium]
MRSRSITVQEIAICTSLVLLAGAGCSSSSGEVTSTAGSGNSATAGSGNNATAGSGNEIGGGSSVAGAPAGGNTSAGGAGSGGSATTGGSGNTAGGQSAGGSGMGGSTSAGGTAGKGGSTAGGASGMGGSSTGGQASIPCPSTVLASGDSTKKITVGALSREYIMHVPSQYKGTSATPLVLDFHPIGGADTSWRSQSPYPAVVDKEGVITLYPNGEPSPNLGNAWNVEGCCTSKISGTDVDDVAFAKAMVTEVEKVACIDTKRVYAVGFSMGGGMSNYLACHAADVFAAVGPASFDLTQQNEPDCKPARPLTVVEWRGKMDNVVPYAGGHSALVTGMAIDFLGAVGTFQKWAALNGCTGSPAAADSNNCQTYSQCTAGVQVTLCTDNNGGHEAAKADVVWPMLKKYTLP